MNFPNFPLPYLDNSNYLEILLILGWRQVTIAGAHSM